MRDTVQCCETGVMPIMKQSHNAQTITSAELYGNNNYIFELKCSVDETISIETAANKEIEECY